jgi:hypothetical protein
MCACSQEVERIYDDTSSISTSRTARMHDVDDFHLFVRLQYPLDDLVFTRMRARALESE